MFGFLLKRKALRESSWKLLLGTDRRRLMAKLADLIEERKELLVSIYAWDHHLLRQCSTELESGESFALSRSSVAN